MWRYLIIIVNFNIYPALNQEWHGHGLYGGAQQQEVTHSFGPLLPGSHDVSHQEAADIA